MTKTLIPLTAKTDGFGPIIFRTKDNVYQFYQYYSSMPSMGDESHNIYLICKDTPVDGDYVLAACQVRKVKKDKNGQLGIDSVSKDGDDIVNKIVATTDQKLIKKGIPSVSEDYVRHFVYKNGDINKVEIEVDSVYVEPPKGMHSNRGHFIEVPKLRDNELNQKEVIIYQEPTPIVDWNKFTMDQFIEHLEDEFMFSSTGTAKAVTELIRAHKEMLEGLRWIQKEYKDKVNDQDDITDKINELLK